MSPVPAINHSSGQCTKAKAVAEIRMQPKVAKKWRPNRRSWKQRQSSSWLNQPQLKNISQIGSFPQVGVKIKDIWNHHLGDFCDPLHWRELPFPYKMVFCVHQLPTWETGTSSVRCGNFAQAERWHSLNLSKSNQHHQRRAAVILSYTVH